MREEMEKKINRDIHSTILALSEKCEDREIFYKSCGSLSLLFDDRGITQNSQSMEEGYAFRFWDKDGFEYFYHTPQWEIDMRHLINTILSNGRKRERSSMSSEKLPSQMEFVQDSSIFCPHTAQLSDKNRQDFVEKIIVLMKISKNRGKNLKNGNLTISDSLQFIANSRGFERGFRKTGASLSLSINCAEDDGIGFIFASSSILDLDPERITEYMCSYPFNILSEKLPHHHVPSRGIYRAMFSPQASSELLKCLTPHLINLKADPSEIPTLSKNVTIIDDPALERGVNSVPFDGAGFPVQKVEIIRNGKFIRPLRSIVRVSYTDPPARGATNLSIKPGRIDPRKMVEEMSEGFYIAWLKPVSSACCEGRISAIGSGFPVRNGTIVPFSRRFYLSEDIFTIFQSIVMIGNDFQFHFWGGCFGSASMMIEKTEMLPIHT